LALAARNWFPVSPTDSCSFTILILNRRSLAAGSGMIRADELATKNAGLYSQLANLVRSVGTAILNGQSIGGGGGKYAYHIASMIASGYVS